jgi:hypothetical protein
VSWQFKDLSLCPTAVVRDPEAVNKEMPEIVKFVQDYGKF